jgi:nickel-dependent lactate racemase
MFTKVMESDFFNIDRDYLIPLFCGFGVGRKLIVPGLSALPTIQHNHALSIHPTRCEIHPDVKIGRLDGNPVAEDLLEATLMTKKDIFIINTVLSPAKKNIEYVLWGLNRSTQSRCRFCKGHILRKYSPNRR